MTSNSNEPGTNKGAQPSNEQLKGSGKQQDLPGKDGRPQLGPGQQQSPPRREEDKSPQKHGQEKQEKHQERHADSASPIKSQSRPSEGPGQQKPSKPSENEPRKGQQ
jgi:hypothetical protein